MAAPTNPNTIPVRQSTVIAGQASLVTFVVTLSDGSTTEIQVYAPPGESITVPTGYMTVADSLYFVSSSYGMGVNDQAGLGLHWDGTNGQPMFVYGTSGTNSPSYLGLLSNNDLPGLMRTIGSINNLCMQIFQSNVVDGQTVVFPTAFSGNQAWVVGMPINGVATVMYTSAQPSNVSFTINAMQVTTSGVSRLTTAATTNFIAIGTHA